MTRGVGVVWGHDMLWEVGEDFGQNDKGCTYVTRMSFQGMCGRRIPSDLYVAEAMKQLLESLACCQGWESFECE